MLVEIVYGRDPDGPCELRVFVTGRPAHDAGVAVREYHSDPGAGYDRATWDASTAAEASKATSREVADAVIALRTADAECDYVEHQEGAWSKCPGCTVPRAFDAIPAGDVCRVCGSVERAADGEVA